MIDCLLEHKSRECDHFVTVHREPIWASISVLLPFNTFASASFHQSQQSDLSWISFMISLCEYHNNERCVFTGDLTRTST